MQSPESALILAGILSAGVLVCIVFAIKRKMTGTQIPVWLPTLTALIVAALLSILASVAPLAYSVPALLLGYVLLALIAVVQAFLFYEKKDLGMAPWLALLVTFIAAMFLVFVFLIGGSVETLPGKAFPAFSYRFPLVGSIIDGIIQAANLTGVFYYSPGYEAILFTGLYIEVFLGAAVIFFILSFGSTPPGQK